MKIVSLKKGHRAFTLIELLVVIAIIGILSSVVLASLNTARNKGADAAIKSNLANARAEAELFYDTAQNYTGVCGTTAANTIGDNVLGAATAAGLTSVTSAAGTTGNAVCNESATAWAAQVMLKSVSGGAVYCVDSTGASIQSATTRISSGTDYVCGS